MGGSPVASRSWVKAHSPYWSLHVEAWRQSGMARADYCRQHGLSTKTFERWMKHLISKEEAREHAKSLQDSRRREQRRQQGKSGKVSETALFRAHGHPLARAPGVLGDACGSYELERDGCSRVCRQLAAFALHVAQMAGPYRERRGGDRLAGAFSSKCLPANKHWC